MRRAQLTAILVATSIAAECPPKGWDRCGRGWPPPANGYCCSSANFLGTSAAHCKLNGGINALDECCKQNSDGTLTCKNDPTRKEEEEHETCPPRGWERCGRWPPPPNGYCCSRAGFLGTSKYHCNYKGLNALKGCCKVKANGQLDCKDQSKPQKTEKKTCPPEGWDRCGRGWPPPANGYCCSSANFLGTSPHHCIYNGGINALDSCCRLNADGSLTCKAEGTAADIDDVLPPEEIDESTDQVPEKDDKVVPEEIQEEEVPQKEDEVVTEEEAEIPEEDDAQDLSEGCTGDKDIDAVLEKANIAGKIGLTNSNSQYTWAGFCEAIREFNKIGDRQFFLGGKSCGQGLSNIAALLAQAMWESGGDAPFSACDENNYTGWPTASCTQRGDGARYDSLTDKPWACEVDKSMSMTAETYASWTPGPMKCEPGTATAGCCWWGRGAIQTTGPNNYGLLNREVISKIKSLKDIDLCKNPEAICQHRETKWLGAIFYWANNVQGYADTTYKKNFFTSLKKFVDGGFSRSASIVSGADFASGTGGVVNNGRWDATPHGNYKRLANFDKIISLFMQAGMGTCSSGAEGAQDADEDHVSPSPQPTSCPPAGWKCDWPPPSNAYCCSKWGFLGLSDGHCGNGGIDATKSCCTKQADGSLSCGTKQDTSDSDSKDQESDESATCPPPGWDRCSTQWPPPADGYCCSKHGYLGDQPGHCSNGGINAMDSCCKKNDFGHFKCKLPPGSCPPPPEVCTGDAEIDKVLKESNLGCEIGLHKLNPTYTWEGFCKAVRQFNSLESERKLFLGDGSAKSCKQGLSNIAALLAQAMWESGGDAPWSACDENNYTGRSTAPCSQRADGSQYASLNDKPWACDVDKSMSMTAVTYASWTPGPMKCEPGSATAGCCWWGRGAIQTTGPNNYGNLNKEVFSQIKELKHIDLCKNPEAICENDETKWLGAIFYWANDVQGFTDLRYKKNFFTSLRKFVDSDFKRQASVVSGADFASGTGGVVNNGWWAKTPHKNEKRLANFDLIMAILKRAGMASCAQ